MPAKKRKLDDDTSASTTNDPSEMFASPSLNNTSIRMSYAIARGEQGVLTFEPYKSILLPHWRFRTVPIAKESSQTLKTAFDRYVEVGDFVGADMSRKFIQMGMTRAKRYANHKGGRKYEKSEKELEAAGRKGEKRVELEKSQGHEGREEKLEASEVFKKVWRECTSDEAYVELRGVWQAEKKAWEKDQKKVKKEEDDGEIDIKVEDYTNG